MKQLSLLFLLCTILCVSGTAATFSGKVESVAACGPVSGQKVYIRDSMHTYVDSTLTNSSGQYSFTLPASLPTGELIYSSVGCAGLITYHAWFAGVSLSNMNFLICGSQKRIIGDVQVGGVRTTAPAKVYLIRKKYDPVVGAIVLTAIDSQTVGTPTISGTYAFYLLCIPTDTIFVKAALTSANPSYSGYLPTYYTSSTAWSSATPVPSANFNASGGTVYTHINMIAGTNPGGSGFIGGSVLVGANKATGVGDPIKNSILILKDGISGNPVAYTYSDATGQFSFSNLAFGTYKLSGDAWGKTNPELSVTISVTKPRVQNIRFEENSKTFMGMITTGVGSHSVLQSLKVYPNPATDYVQVSGLAGIAGSKTLTLTNAAGQLAARRDVSGSDMVSISTSSLSSGVYFLKVTTDEGIASYTVVK